MSGRRRGGGRGHGATPHRVAEELRMKLMELLTRHVHDPRVRGVHVTDVAMSRDFSSARVSWRATPGGPSIEEARAGLESVSGFLRRELGRAMHLRRAPALDFEHDALPEAGDRIEQLLVEARHGASPPPAPADPAAGDDGPGEAAPGGPSHADPDDRGDADPDDRDQAGPSDPRDEP